MNNDMLCRFRSILVTLCFCSAIALSAAVTPAIAQHALTLDECLKIAHQQSPALIEAKRSYDAATESAIATSRGMRSSVDLVLSAPIYTDNTSPIYNPATGTTDLLPQRESQYGGQLIVNQPIYWTGGLLSFTGNLFRRAQQGTAGTTINDYLGLGSIALTQPLFKANDYKLTQRESDMDLDLARAGFVSQWASLNYTVKSLFFNLYQAEQQLKIQQDEVDASQANYELANNKFKAGLIAEVDALQLEVDLASAKTDLFDRQRLLLSAQRQLQSALGLPLEGPISAKLDTLSDINLTIDPNTAIQYALASRADMLAARENIDRNEIAYDRTASSRTVSASLIGSFGASQDVQQFAQLSDNPALNRGLSLAITVPLFDWGAQAMKEEAAESNIELSKVAVSIKEHDIELEVRSVIEQYEAAKKQLDVAKRSVEVAQKAYDLSRARFDMGKITSQDLALDQQRLTRARFSTLTAEVAEHLSLADLTQKTLFDFETGKPVEVTEEMHY